MLLPDRKQAFFLPFLASFLANLGLLYWIPYLMEKGLYAVLAIGMILLLSYMSLFTGLVGLAVNTIARKSKPLALFAFPVLWTAQEKFRELGEMSFPWVTAGYTFGPYIKLIQALSLFGVYFYSFLIAFTAVLLYYLSRFKQDKKVALRALGGGFIIYALLLSYGHFRVNQAPSVEKTTTVALIQPNISTDDKWSPARSDSIFLLHCSMTAQAAACEKLDLAVWPESALPCYFLRRFSYQRHLTLLADSLKVPILFGSLDFDFKGANPREPRYFNSVFFYAPGSGCFGKYDKIKLVPFGEALPFQGLFPIISRVNLGEADFTPGDSLKLFSAKEHRFFTPICYEVVYPEQMRAFARLGGEMMVQVTNDAWYRRSGMTFQHANICRFRAVETGVPVARCANTGLSCFIDPLGRMDHTTEIFTSTTPIKHVPAWKYETFFNQHGDLVGWGCLIAAVFGFGAFFIITQFRKKHE